MKNFIQPGKNMTVVAGGAIVAGIPQLINGLVGIASGSAASGEEYELALEGVFEIPKDTALVVAQGVKVGYDISAGEVVAVGTTEDFDLGHCFKAAASGELTMQVRLLSSIDEIV